MTRVATVLTRCKAIATMQICAVSPISVYVMTVGVKRESTSSTSIPIAGKAAKKKKMRRTMD